MTRTEYKAAVGLFYISMLAFFVVLGIILVAYPFIQDMGNADSLLYILGAVFIFCGLFLVIFARVKYVFHDDGISINGMIGATMLNEEYLNEIVPYRSMTEIRETKDIAYAAGFTSDAIRIYYIKKNKRKDSFVIGPVDKEEFMEELERRTGLRVKRIETRSGK